MSKDTPDRRIPQLKHNQQTGSKPRCHLLTAGTRETAASRLTGLISTWGKVNADDVWMPDGFNDVTEAQLPIAASIIPDKGVRDELFTWWLAAPGDRNTTTPNWDIASTCTIEGKKGVLLIEAKAHDAELRNEEKGKALAGQEGRGVSIDSRRNHVRIGACIQDASLALSGATDLPWALSRDWNYQMANRFTWSWKLASLGVPVVLVYLGFLHCLEMPKPFTTDKEWDDLVKTHSASLFPAQVWDQRWPVNGHAFIPIIRTVNQPLGENP